MVAGGKARWDITAASLQRLGVAFCFTIRNALYNLHRCKCHNLVIDRKLWATKLFTGNFREKHPFLLSCMHPMVPLLCPFRLNGDEVELACEFALTLADTIRFVWPTSDNMLAYWHMCDVELSRELRHVHTTHGVGVGAFVCQGVEAMSHQIKVVAQQSCWDPDTFLGFLRFASEHDVLGIRASRGGTGEDLYMAIEQSEAWGPRFAPPMRKRKYSSAQKG